MSSIRILFNRWVIVGSFLFACSLIFVFLISILLMKPASLRTEVLPPVVQKIPASTATLEILQSVSNSAGQAPPNIDQSDSGSSTQSPGEISTGTYVKITGTGGDGLRLRDEPGLGGNVKMLGEETEVFVVDDGPRNVDGYVWWYLKGYYDETRQGWAVVDYLSIVENP